MYIYCKDGGNMNIFISASIWKFQFILEFIMDEYSSFMPKIIIMAKISDEKIFYDENEYREF